MSDFVASWEYREGVLRALEEDRASDDEQTLLAGLTVAVCTYQRPGSLRRFLESVTAQDRRPNEIIIVDASSEGSSEQVVRDIAPRRGLSDRVVYIRVDDNLRGLTKQRNLALHLASFHSIAFFDDDVVLEPQCLRHLEQALLSRSDAVGVGAFVANDDKNLGMRLRFLRLLGAVPNLVPGEYTRSGISIPLRILGLPDSSVCVDRLPGCSFMCRTALAREVGFNETFGGYALAEDLEFSRRAAAFGRLLICGAARVKHLHDPSGRPDLIRLGRQLLFNRYFVHKTTLHQRTWSDVLWFAYAQAIDCLITYFGFLRRLHMINSLQFLWGAVLGSIDIVRWRRSRNAAERRGSL